jgi:hypothetical protein
MQTMDGKIFALSVVLISVLGWLASNWIRARHGYPLIDDDSGAPDTNRKVELVSRENGQLKEQIGRLEERIAVLERIATDRTSRLSDEIDALR